MCGRSHHEQFQAAPIHATLAVTVTIHDRASSTPVHLLLSTSMSAHIPHHSTPTRSPSAVHPPLIHHSFLHSLSDPTRNHPAASSHSFPASRSTWRFLLRLTSATATSMTTNTRAARIHTKALSKHRQPSQHSLLSGRHPYPLDERLSHNHGIHLHMNTRPPGSTKTSSCSFFLSVLLFILYPLVTFHPICAAPIPSLHSKAPTNTLFTDPPSASLISVDDIFTDTAPSRLSNFFSHVSHNALNFYATIAEVTTHASDSISNTFHTLLRRRRPDSSILTLFESTAMLNGTPIAFEYPSLTPERRNASIMKALSRNRNRRRDSDLLSKRLRVRPHILRGGNMPYYDDRRPHAHPPSFRSRSHYGPASDYPPSTSSPFGRHASRSDNPFLRLARSSASGSSSAVSPRTAGAGRDDGRGGDRGVFRESFENEHPSRLRSDNAHVDRAPVASEAFLSDSVPPDGFGGGNSDGSAARVENYGTSDVYEERKVPQREERSDDFVGSHPNDTDTSYNQQVAAHSGNKMSSSGAPVAAISKSDEDAQASTGKTLHKPSMTAATSASDSYDSVASAVVERATSSSQDSTAREDSVPNIGRKGTRSEEVSSIRQIDASRGGGESPENVSAVDISSSDATSESSTSSNIENESSNTTNQGSHSQEDDSSPSSGKTSIGDDNNETDSDSNNETATLPGSNREDAREGNTSVDNSHSDRVSMKGVAESSNDGEETTQATIMAKTQVETLSQRPDGDRSTGKSGGDTGRESVKSSSSTVETFGKSTLDENSSSTRDGGGKANRGMRPDVSRSASQHFRGVHGGMVNGENITQLSLMVYKVAKAEGATSMAAAPCYEVRHWMPAVVERLESEIIGFEFFCIDTSEKKDALAELKDAYGEVSGSFIQVSPEEVNKSIPKGLDLVVSWMGIQQWGMRKGWRFVKGVRQSGSKMLLLGNNSIRSNMNLRKEDHKLNVRKAPMLFNEPSRVIRKVAEDETKQLLLYDVENVRDGL